MNGADTLHNSTVDLFVWTGSDNSRQGFGSMVKNISIDQANRTAGQTAGVGRAIMITGTGDAASPWFEISRVKISRGDLPGPTNEFTMSLKQLTFLWKGNMLRAIGTVKSFMKKP